MARRLGIPPEELGDVKKNVIVRSLGPDPLVQVDVEGPYPLEDGDTFVLCCDGLSNQVPPEEIGAVVSGPAAGGGRPVPDRTREPARRAGQHHGGHRPGRDGPRLDGDHRARPGRPAEGGCGPIRDVLDQERPVADQRAPDRVPPGGQLRDLRGQRVDVRGDDLFCRRRPSAIVIGVVGLYHALADGRRRPRPRSRTPRRGPASTASTRSGSTPA